MRSLIDRLDSGIKNLAIELTKQQQNNLIDYLLLIEKWNRSYNLTAISKPEDMLVLHLLDSLSVVPLLKGEHFIDVGTGAGLPGIVLAIALPQQQFTLLDTNGKKTRFLLQVKAELSLNNVQVIKSRAEDFTPQKKFDAVLSRAFTSLKEMLNCTEQLCVQNGHFYAMKGQYPEKELRDLPKGFNVKACHTLSVPDLEGQRHLVVIQKEQHSSP